MKVLITGATAGIGQATAKAFAKTGAELILTGRRKERLDELQKELAPARVTVATLDVRSRESVEKFLKDYESLLKDVDVLVNNAGLAKGADKLQDGRIEDWEQVMQTNVMGLLYLTRGILPLMISRKKGHIVNLGSVAGRWTYAGGAVYCASKFAVRALTEGLRMDLLGHPIRVTSIEPGMVHTDFSEIRFGNREKANAVYAGMKPLTAEDIADTILWVAERPAHVNIQELVIFPTDQAAISMVHRV